MRASAELSIVSNFVFVEVCNASKVSTFKLTLSVLILIFAVLVAIVSKTELSIADNATICSAELLQTNGLKLPADTSLA